MERYRDSNLGLPKKLLSVVIPCHNEQDVIRETYDRMSAVLDDLHDIDSEMVFVDDGSVDRTSSILTTLCALDSRVRLLRLSRNFGQQIAVTAGLEHASGDAVVPIDADLQDPPEVISDMVAKWREGYDVVYGTRLDREGEPAFRLWAINQFYKLSARITESPIPINSGDFRLLDRKVVNAVLLMPERHRFVRGLVAWAGFRQVGLPYRRHSRWAGRSKYPLRKLASLAADSIFSASVVPLRVITWLGVGSLGASLIVTAYALAMHLFAQSWTALYVIVLFLGGVQLVSVGIIGEYIGRLYGESKRRPLYLVQDKIGFRSADRMLGFHPKP